MNTFNEYYRDNVIPSLMEQFKYKSAMEVPRLKKITLNMGLGSAINDKKILETGVVELTQISGQKAIYTYAKKSIANFKLREGMPIGCKVTLRKEKMYDFFEKLIKISLPRVRDFRGLSQKSFDGRGNYTLGIKEHIIFPEIDFDRIDKIKGLDITITTTAKNDQEALELFKQFNFPFK
ncbi:MAG: 50S ribosomal protein L5 [Pseudomonadota bacterium]|nr:50S ribosomal protein L5 [Pseudomonadota bacterium]MEC8996114.1 50S ribosomal protein L5 [Pseudomonadota bacterium]MED5274994.1 50S ribosomal protein L5 [Pseudomonadota bacterium]|tara:strand:+ start:1634 stop:2170 length:537 start_codon:yes stop_codon:yes gene_type:complete